MALQIKDGNGILATLKSTTESSEHVMHHIVQGQAAHDAAASGNPVRLGGVYHSAAPSVADGDVVDLLTDAAGRLAIGSLPASTNTLEVVGDVAHDSAAGGNPVLIGAYAGNAHPAAVANADAVRVLADLFGRLVVTPGAPVEKYEQYVSPADITDTADDEVFAATASVRHCITSITVTCSHASTGTYVVVKDGSTVIWQAYCGAAGGGAAIAFTVPLVGTANTAINVANLTTSSATRVSISGYQLPG